MKTRTKSKTLDDVKMDMSILYDEIRSGEADLKFAAELANVTGKFLKAEQLKLAREIFASGLREKIISPDVAAKGQIAALEMLKSSG